jgi:hypothetical protein
MLAPGDATTRCAAVRHWLASVTLPNGTRSAASSAIEAIAHGKRKGSADAIRLLATTAAPLLDQASMAELRELADEIGGGTTPHEPRNALRDHGRS